MRHLLPNHVYVGFQAFCGIEGKGLTVKVECNDDPLHNDRQRQNNLFSVPNRHTNGINGHIIPENCLHGIVDEDVRAKDNQ